MNRIRSRQALVLIAAFSVIPLFAQAAHGQTLAVTPSASPPTPNPALVSELVASSLSATAANPPSGTYTCPVHGPSWSWTIQAVRFSNTSGGPWQLAAANTYSASISEPNNAVADATLTASFFQAGYWDITATVTATYTDSPCADTWTASGTTDVLVTVVGIGFTPNPDYVPAGGTSTLTVTTTPPGYYSDVTVDTDDHNIATVIGSPPTVTVVGVQPGSTLCFGRFRGRRCPQTCPIIVFTLDITNSNAGDVVLVSPVTSENVAVRTDLKAKVTPAGLNPTYTWSIGGSAIKTYNHRIDDTTIFKTFPLDNPPTGPQVSYFWTAGGNGIAVTLNGTLGNATFSKTVNFNVGRLDQQARTIYCADAETLADADKMRRNPNGSPPGKYTTIDNHVRWHGGQQMKLYYSDGTTNTLDPTGSYLDGFTAIWGDSSNIVHPGSNTGPFFGPGYAGYSFLVWHKKYMDARYTWSSAFAVTDIDPTKNPGPNVQFLVSPVFLRRSPGAPPATTSWGNAVNGGTPNPEEIREVSRYYGYVRLGEFQDQNQLGKDMSGLVGGNWHGAGHSAVGVQGAKYAEMPTFQSPHSPDDVFWWWHTLIEFVRNAWSTDQANPGTPVATGGATPSVQITFDNKVSCGAPAVNTIQITGGALTVDGNAAGTVTNVGSGDTNFKVFKFTGFTAPAKGANVKIVLTGTASFAGGTWTVTWP